MERIMINLEEYFHRRYFKKDIVTIAEMLEKIEELDDEIEHLREAYQELENDIKENYRAIPVKEQLGISERDFI